MIVGTGIDLIQVSRIRKQLEKSGHRFFETLFTEREIGYCQKGSSLSRQSQCFSGRFCAKEAFLKALGSGLRDGIFWKDMEILNDELGKPYFILRNRVQEIIKEKEITQVHLSISHDKNMATAMVILENQKLM